MPRVPLKKEKKILYSQRARQCTTSANMHSQMRERGFPEK